MNVVCAGCIYLLYIILFHVLCRHPCTIFEFYLHCVTVESFPAREMMVGVPCWVYDCSVVCCLGFYTLYSSFLASVVFSSWTFQNGKPRKPVRPTAIKRRALFFSLPPLPFFYHFPHAFHCIFFYCPCSEGPLVAGCLSVPSLSTLGSCWYYVEFKSQHCMTVGLLLEGQSRYP